MNADVQAAAHLGSTTGQSSLTSRSLTSCFTLAASLNRLPVQVSLISVDKKFLHLFTFSIVSWWVERMHSHVPFDHI